MHAHFSDCRLNVDLLHNDLYVQFCGCFAQFSTGHILNCLVLKAVRGSRFLGVKSDFSDVNFRHVLLREGVSHFFRLEGDFIYTSPPLVHTYAYCIVLQVPSISSICTSTILVSSYSYCYIQVLYDEYFYGKEKWADMTYYNVLHTFFIHM